MKSYQKPARVAFEEDLKAGYDIEMVWGDDFHLTVDLDTEEAIEKFYERHKLLNEKFYTSIEGEWKSKSGKGKHVLLKTYQRVGFKERAALQAFLGSDLKRELLGYFDVNNTPEEDPFVLFRPVEEIPF